jgi:hypothetical protein
MKIKKFNKIFEADIKSTEGVPEEYIKNIEKIAKKVYGFNGPSNEDMRRMGFLMMNIMQIQHGKEEELTEIGKEIIEEQYGEILEGANVRLDIKIVRPYDKEQIEMVKKQQKEEQEIKKEPENEPEIYKSEDIESEIAKRKILNNLMQGEAQNVQSMMYTKKNEIQQINPELLDFYKEFFNINKKFDWKEGMNLEEVMKAAPGGANMMDTDFEEDPENEGEERPVIKVRALDLMMVIHETVKGIYELILAHAIPEDPVLAQKIKDATYSLKDEQEDVKYGPYIAATVRDYINSLLQREYSKTVNEIKNLREFVYARLAGLDSKVFVELFKYILSDKTKEADVIMLSDEYNLVNGAIDDATYEDEDDEEEEIYNKPDNKIKKFNELDDIDLDEVDKLLKTPGKKSYEDMNKRELQKEIDAALDRGDYGIIKHLQELLDQKR